MKAGLVTRLDMSSPDSQAALHAEKRLFAYYGLKYRTHSIQLDKPKLRVRVLEIGNGEPVLMLPGGSGDAWQFAPLMAQIKGRTLIAVNRPGGGLSDGVDYRRIDMRELAIQVVTSTMDAFALPSVDIIANSMGGLWAFWFALARPQRVRRVVQMGCPAASQHQRAFFHAPDHAAGREQNRAVRPASAQRENGAAQPARYGHDAGDHRGNAGGIG